ncbi:MAG TPA: BatA domain-containing protein [Cyclobacteriaceae bacterium]|nr:BatA domain-containing protein [Cyclobacteriaceae bacterium]
MSLVYPSFLWALSALAIPIIIHLFNFRKTTRIYFSNTRFLKQVKEETTQKRRLKQYLVLASRLLFLFFLVLAFAQPFLPAREEMTNQQSIAIYLDNSFSMASPVAEKTRALDEAIRMARQIVDLFPASVRFQLITNDFYPFSSSFKSKAEISDLLSQIKLSAISRSASEVLHRVNEKQAAIFWLSDFQKSTFGTGAKVDSLQPIHLVPLALEKYANVFVDSVYAENPFVIGGEKNTIKVRLRNVGKKNAEGLVTKLSINGVQAAATTVSINADSYTEVPFDLTFGLKGNNKAVITFSDFPISFDNEFYFTLNYTTKLNVLEIKTGTLPTFVEKVFGNHDVFSFHSFRTANLNYSLLVNADLIVINGIDRIDDALSEAINSYRGSFGALLFVPGPQPDLNSYQKLLSVPISKSPEAELAELEKPDFQNPFFANVFEDKNSPIAMPSAQGVLDWGTDRSAILKFKNNKPFLSQFGKTFILASPLEKPFTDFFNHALFVPVMYRLAASGKKADVPLYYSLTSSTVIVPSDSLVSEEPVKLIGNQEFIPTQRHADGKLFLELPKYAVSSGFYKITSRKDTLGLIAFDLDKTESFLQQMTGEEAKAALGGRANISIFKANSPETFSTEIKERYLGKPLWKYAIVLSLIFLLAEVLLIRFLK